LTVFAPLRYGRFRPPLSWEGSAMAEAVYLLCSITSIVCAVLLFGGFRRSGTRLLFWSALCFVGLALNNLLLFVDLIVVPTIDLSMLRAATALGGLAVLVFGLIWESR
jgi:hypothetical protein